MNEVFVGAIFSSNWYNGQVEKVSEYIGNKRSILIGMPRLRQFRIMKSKINSFRFLFYLYQVSVIQVCLCVTKVYLIRHE